MSSDGAQQGVAADDALNVIIGGTPEGDVPHVSTQEMAERVMSRTEADTRSATGGTYGSAADYAAKTIVEWYMEDPSRLSDGDPYEAMKAAGIPLADYGLTGFQWGWALNAARAILELPAVPNPAIVTLKADQ